MGFLDTIKSLFGVSNDNSNHGRRPEEEWRRNSWNSWRRDDLRDDFGNGFRFDNEIDHIFNEMDSMFSRMFSSFGHNFDVFEDSNHQWGFGPWNDHGSMMIERPTRSPREMMLKDDGVLKLDVPRQDSSRLPVVRQDMQREDMTRTDMPRHEMTRNWQGQGQGQIMSKSVFYQSKFGSNGRMEEHRTVKDGTGYEETTVTQQLGDKSYSQTVKRNDKGVIEENQELTNMDERELDDFKRKWNKLF